MTDISCQIKIIPIELPFLKILANYFWEKFKESFPDFYNILIIFPSQRNKFYFRKYLLEESKKEGIIPPQMKTVEEFMGYIYEIMGGEKGKLLEKIERNFLLKEVIDFLKVEFWKDIPFLKFISVGDRLINFFDELAKERVTLDEIEKKIILEHYPEKYVKNEIPIIKKIYKEYRKKLKEKNYKDEIDKYNFIYENFDHSILKMYKYIFIAGLVGLTKIENKIFKEILENRESEFIIHSEKNELKNNSLESPFYSHSELLNLWKVNIEEIEIISKKEKILQPVYHIKNAGSETQQSFYLRDVLEKVKNSYSLPRICIVLPDEKIVYSVTETLKAMGLNFNLSMGLPFTHSVLYSFLNQLMETIKSNYHYKEFFNFIKHPVLKNVKIDGNSLHPYIYELQNFMIKNNLNYFSLENLEEEFEKFQPFINILKECFDTVCRESSFSEYIQGIVTMLNNLISPSKEVFKISSPEIGDFLKELNKLSRLKFPDRIPFKGIKMLEFILEVLKYQRYNLVGDFLRGIQVIGVLEARNLDFDCIILLSANEGIFPQFSEKDLFLNQQLRIELNLPYEKKRESLYHYYFTEMTKGKKEVFISYISDEKKKVCSRFVNFLIDEHSLNVEEEKPKFRKSLIEISKREIRRESNLHINLLNKLENEGLTPSDLKDYKECPYRFYLNYMLEIKITEEPVEEPDSTVWGNIIHNTLREFYRYEYPNFLKLEKEEIKKILYEKLRISMNKILAKKPKKVTYLEMEIYKNILEKFLISEETRLCKEDIKVDISKLEERIEKEININGIKVKLKGRPDRVDIVKNKYYIIDYKCTNTPPPRKEYQLGEEFKEFQIPLYSLILSEDNFKKICGMGYYILNSKKIEIVEIEKGEKIPEYLENFKEKILLPTIKKIIEEDFPATSNRGKNCKYCIYTGICGVKNV